MSLTIEEKRARKRQSATEARLRWFQANRFADGVSVTDIRHADESLEELLLTPRGDDRTTYNLGGGCRWHRSKSTAMG